MSGIVAVKDAVEAYQTFKLQNSRKGEKYAYIIYRITEDETIVIANTEEMGPSNEKNWEKFIGYITENNPVYAVFDFQIEHNDRQLNKIVFVSYVPDHAKVKYKMWYGSTKESFKSELGTGIAVDIQAADLKELDYDTVKAAVIKGK